MYIVLIMSERQLHEATKTTCFAYHGLLYPITIIILSLLLFAFKPLPTYMKTHIQCKLKIEKFRKEGWRVRERKNTT